MTLYRKIEMPTDEPVQFIGVYVMSWGTTKPTVGFIEVDENGDDVE